MALIQNYVALTAALLFGAAALFIGYFLSKTEGYGDFSVGISLLDFYSVIMTIVPLTASVSYFVMALGLGQANLMAADIHWLRYFEWAISTPILIMGIVMLSGDRELTFKAIILDFIMIVTGFAAAVTVMPYSAVLFGVSSAALLGLIYILLRPATEKVEDRPEVIRDLFSSLRNLTIAIWLIYPFVWLPSQEALGIWSAELSFLIFTALDLTSKLGYALLVVWNIEKVNQA